MTTAAENLAATYNARGGITKLAYDDHEGVWRMMHTNNPTRQTYTDTELVEVGKRMGWDR